MMFSAAVIKYLDRSNLGRAEGLFWFTGQGVRTACLAGSQTGGRLKQLVTSHPQSGSPIMNTVLTSLSPLCTIQIVDPGNGATGVSRSSSPN